MVGSLTLGAAAIAGVYNWATNVYSYNRDAWMTDMQVVQEYRYQKDNLKIQMQSMQREEVRDLFQASINKINNAILVSTLILSLAGEMLFEGQIPDDCPTFVLNAYMLCLGSAIFHLVLSIVFGIFGSNVAYTVCTQLLTKRIKPAWRRHFQQMNDQRQEEATLGFEAQSLKSMLKPPLVSRLDWFFRSHHPVADPTVPGTLESDFVDNQASILLDNDRDQTTTGEADDVEWAIEWSNQEKNWIQYTICMNICVAFGTKHLLEAIGYLCTAMLYGKYSHAWAFWVVQIIFTGLNVLMMASFMKEADWPEHCRCLAKVPKLLLSVIPAFGPALSATAAATALKEVDQICVPLGYTCHLIINVFQSMVCDSSSFRPPDCGPSDCNGGSCSNGKAVTLARSSGSMAKLKVEAVLDEGASGCVNRRSTSAIVSSDIGDQAAAVAEERKCGLESLATGSSVIPEVPDRASRSVQLLANAEEEEDDDDDDTEAKAKAKRVPDVELSPNDMLLRGLRVLRILWICAIVWACKGNPRFQNQRAPLMRLPKDLLVFDKVQFSPPSPFFRALTVTCPHKDLFYMADKFRVWSFNQTIAPDDKPSSVSCAVDSKIADIGSRCNGRECWPVVLLQGHKGQPPRVFDCTTNRSVVLRKTSNYAHRFATNSSPATKMHTIYAAQGSEVLEYEGVNGTYFPQWIVSKLAVSAGNILGLDIDGELLVVIQKGGAVMVQHLGSGAVCGTWKVPLGDRIIGGGCAYNRTIHFLVEKDLRMSLQKAELPASVMACGDR